MKIVKSGKTINPQWLGKYICNCGCEFLLEKNDAIPERKSFPKNESFFIVACPECGNDVYREIK
jgi:hypothetical protein